MESLTAIGLVSNIIEFVDLGVKLLRDAREIYESASGATEINENREFTTKKIQEFGDSLVPPANGVVTGNDKFICDLAWQCRGLALDIGELLDEVKPHDSGSSSQNVFNATESKRFEKRRDELQGRLKICQDQLGLHLNNATWADMKSGLDLFIASSKENADCIVQLQKQVESLRSLNNTLSGDCQLHLSGLLEISEDSYETFLSDRFVSYLKVDSIDKRFDDIARAHDKTFEWIFDEDDDNDGMDPYRLAYRQSFNSWLLSGDGVFHISGKLGSGKSTLMKLICRDARTESRLKKWADEHELVMARLFFSKPPILCQDPMRDLLHSLLYQCLKSSPGLVKVAFPEKWDKIKSMPMIVYNHFTLDTLLEAFGRLVENCGAQRYRICFFIDALDEFDDSGMEDYTALIDRISDWSRASRGNVKFCVSSREDNVILNGFSNIQRLTMQDLTRWDIDRFVRDKLEISGPGKEGLLRSIGSRADGSFLWVVLVIRRLCDLNERGETLERMEREMDIMPNRLEDLLRYLLESIHPSDQGRAYRTFAVINKLNEETRWGGGFLTIPLDSYYFFDDCSSDLPDDSIPALAGGSGEMSKFDRHAQAHKMLMRTCQGLLEPTNITLSPELSETVISFTHRSVPEFLDSVRSPAQQEHLNGFCLESAISRLLLINLWEMRADGGQFEYMSFLSYRIAQIRSRAKISRHPFMFEEQLQAALARNGDLDIDGEHDYQTIGIRAEFGAEVGIRKRNYQIGTCKPHGKNSYYICKPVFIAAVVGNSGYVLWKLSQDPSFLENRNNVALLFYCVFHGLEEDSEWRGWEDLPFHTLHTMTTDISPSTSSLLTKSDEEVTLSIWHHLILYRITDVPDYESGNLFFLEEALKRGADARIEVLLTSKMRRGLHVVRFLFGKERRPVEFLLDLENEIWEYGYKALYEAGKVRETTVADLFNRDEILESPVLTTLAALARQSNDSPPLLDASAAVGNNVTMDGQSSGDIPLDTAKGDRNIDEPTADMADLKAALEEQSIDERTGKPGDPETTSAINTRNQDSKAK
ncbi:hypothetical protein BO70DRAFT_357437 [Aspergillus heteromorphus CBS 117.55]|uniref:Nephrocystin 3-like N-terminal domain-containing protein n=1 Tax=Aspergillus heteromorphus CBS 117.55 TaxID=1448321 RepID=A0A317X195_9EURO|nr:uncharacterized protein BO70DRAFT_357437 [Aspergillus heteromorphus CBS 117.55]PWY92323.1 hypothetical protein BO70DRAFT_357437 [Aspergillus heteromorphus CBS 117.55]